MGWMTLIQFLAGQGIFLLPQHPNQLCDPPSLIILQVPGTLSPRVKWPGHKIHCLPPSSAKVKNSWSCTSTSPCLHGVVLN